jgi:hypothetical protein
MRNEINVILLFIGTSTLTDNEFLSINLSEGYSDKDFYDAILAILTARASDTSTINRLYHYFMAMGVSLEAPNTAKCNIFLGAALNGF